MREYSLRFHDGSTNNPKTITFQSEDAREAFSIIQQKKLNRPVEIYEGHRSLGTITQSSKGVWVVEANGNSASPDG